MLQTPVTPRERPAYKVNCRDSRHFCRRRREARALGNPVEAADTDVAAAEEETRGEARSQGGAFKAAFDYPETWRSLCEEEAPAIGLG